MYARCLHNPEAKKLARRVVRARGFRSIYVQQHGVCNFHVRSTWESGRPAVLIYAQIIGGALIKHDTIRSQRSADGGLLKLLKFITLRAKVFPIHRQLAAGLLELQKRRICACGDFELETGQWWCE